jgi:hypothetical protein
MGPTLRRLAPWITGCVLAAVVAMTPLEAQAQSQPSQRSDEMSRQEMLVRIIDQFERRLTRELKLSDEQLDAIREITVSMRSERREVYQRRRALDERMREFAREGGSDREARRILSESRAIRAAEARIEAEEEARLLEILSPAQVLQFHAMRDELNERIRRLHRRGGDDGPGRSSMQMEELKILYF